MYVIGWVISLGLLIIVMFASYILNLLLCCFLTKKLRDQSLEWCCSKCGYMSKGWQTSYCPECGMDSDVRQPKLQRSRWIIYGQIANVIVFLFFAIALIGILPVWVSDATGLPKSSGKSAARKVYQSIYVANESGNSDRVFGLEHYQPCWYVPLMPWLVWEENPFISLVELNAGNWVEEHVVILPEKGEAGVGILNIMMNLRPDMSAKKIDWINRQLVDLQQDIPDLMGNWTQRKVGYSETLQYIEICETGSYLHFRMFSVLCLLSLYLFFSVRRFRTSYLLKEA